MNPRRIPECITAFQGLDIDKLWIRNMYEADIVEVWPKILKAAKGYDRLIMASDDGVPRQHALDAVTALLDEGHPVVTGYSNLAYNDMRVNISKMSNYEKPAVNAHQLYTLTEVMEYQEPVVPTVLVGFALTGMPYELWERFGFSVWNDFPGNASDFCLSKKLVEAEVPMVAARDAFVWHVKEQWNLPDKDDRKRLLINSEPRALELERR